jgi:stearoyl-CoA desaturase (delta-9 desaturase)
MLSGVLALPWWGYAVVALALTHVTIAAVTIYLHRHQAHRALEMHPAVSHFFRFWLWLTTGMVTREWAAVHRKHHAKCETPEDPHSPQVLGINRVLWGGLWLYKKEAANRETVEKYGHGAPDDWLERHLYTPHNGLGIALMAVIGVVLFGVGPGLAIFAVQMVWIPFWAAGVVNGIGHWWGYRNFACADASTNIVPWGIVIGGEELHNNHHAYAGSAKLSNRWYEFDVGWLYIRILETLGLARVKKIAPRIRFEAAKDHCDLQTLQAVIAHRYDVMANYARSVRKAYLQEVQRLRERMPHPALEDRHTVKTLKRWLHLDDRAIEERDRARIQEVLRLSQGLQTICTMRQELAALWSRSAASQEQLVKQLEDWCRRAEASEIDALRKFSLKLRRYA